MPLLTDEQIAAAIEYNTWSSAEVFETEGLPEGFIRDYHERLSSTGAAVWAPESKEYAQATATFQSHFDQKVDGKLGTRTLGKIHERYPSETGGPLLLTDEAKSIIVGFTVKFEGGNAKNPYASMNKDAEWLGAFDRPKRDKANKRIPAAERKNHPGFKPHRASKYHPGGGFHIGLSWGAWQAAQEPGALGQLLTKMKARAPILFNTVFGDDCLDLIEVTTARNRRTGKLSARTRKVGGAYLWDEPWLSRFKAAANEEVFREVQRVWVAGQYLDKSLSTAEEYNLDSLGALAVLFDIAVQFGVGGMKKYVGKAKLTSGAPFDPGSIKRVIRCLPKSHHKRRNHILDEAGQDTRYTW
jgi:hypothetical protein